MAWIDISVMAVALAVLCAWLALTLTLRARRSQRRFQLLGAVAEVSERAASLEETFDAICDILVPEVADFCAIDMIEEGRPRRVGVRVSPDGGADAERGLRTRVPSVPERMVAGEGGLPEPRFYGEMSEANLREIAHDEEDLEFLRGLGVRSAITLALQARGQVKGALTLAVAWSGRRYSGDDLRFAWVLSGRVALTLDNSGLFADLERSERARAEIAETLQRGLLPPALPHVPGWSLAAIYRPAGAENEVGGDFYDAFQVRDGWMVVIGDVTGRGARAASITALARYTLRTAAMLTNDPVAALATLNRALMARNDASLCSIAALTLSEDPRRPVRIAVAGHLPPLLIDGEQVCEAAGADPLLGAFADSEWRIQERTIEPGQQLAVVTDGVVEAAGEGDRFGEQRLRDELADARNPAGVVRRVDSALRAFTAGALEDDVAILALARTAGGEDLAEAMVRVEGMAGEDGHDGLVQRLYNAFNQRDEAEIVALCSPEMEFFPVTAEEVGRVNAYIGPGGLHDYLADVARFWEELLITPTRIERRDDRLLVSGRVYVRNREIGIRDMPVAWVWDLTDGLFVRGEVFADPENAKARFAGVAA
jgi:serine phosphatase RsbU (regulator of sigma subunit)/ketosteroid isomerase-like protein